MKTDRIDFTDDITRLTQQFTGRKWVFQEIDRWLQRENERFFILVGEPGIGKSALVAKLIQIREDIAAYHFCISGRSGTIEPNNVLLSLMAQLIEYFPGYAEALVNIIKPLQLSVEVKITINSIKDSIVQGVVINHLHTQNAQEALNIILRQSLAALPNPPKQHRLILIDSLDEAITFRDKNNLVTLLNRVDDLPPWLRLIVTSRPDDRVLVKFEPLKPYQIQDSLKENLEDIQEYVKKRIYCPSFQEHISAVNLKSQTLIEEITNLSSGNFLYTKLLLNDIELGKQSLNDLSALPKSIDDIYLAFLRRFNFEEWKNQYQPILGTLTVTQEPVTEDELANFTRISPRILRQNLGIICQFLDVVDNKKCGNTYAIFHQSLRDYLLSKERNKYFWCDSQEQHQIIIDYFEEESKKWQQLRQISRYGLYHLAYHLLNCGQKNDLYKLLTYSSDWMEAKFIGCIGDTEYVNDLEIALNSISDPLLSEQFLFLTQIHTARRVIRQRSERYYSGSFAKALIWLGREAEVLNYARLSPDSGRRYATLANTFKTLKETRRTDSTLLEEVWQAAQVIEDISHRSGALGDVAVELAGIGETAKAGEALNQARDTAEQIDEGQHKTRALLRLAEHLCQTGNQEHREEAIKVYLYARETAAKMQDCQKRVMLPSDLDMAILEDWQWRAMLLCELSQSQWQKHFYQEAIDALEEAQTIAETTKQKIDDLRNRVKELPQIKLRLTLISSENCWQEEHQLTLRKHSEVISIENFLKSEHQNYLHLSLAEVYIAMQRFQEAKQSIYKIDTTAHDYDWIMTAAIQSMVSALIKTNQILEAENLLLQIQNSSEKIYLTGEIFTVLALSEKSNSVIKAESILAEVKDIIENQIEDKQQKDLSLYHLVQSLAKANWFNEAEAMSLKIANQQQQSAALLSLTQILIQRNYLTEVEHFAKVKKVTDGIKNSQNKLDALADLCIALCKKNYRIEAERVLTEAQKIPHTVVDFIQWISILCTIAQLADKAGLIQLSMAIFEQARNYIKTISDPVGQSSAEVSLALNLAKSNYFFEDAENAARRIQEKQWKESVFLELVITLLNQKLFCEAEIIVKEIEDRQIQIDALSQLGVALFKTEHKELYQEKIDEIFITLIARAEMPRELKILVKALSQVERYNHAEKIASSIQELSLRAEALSELAKALAQKGDFSEAKRVLNTIEADWLRVEVLIAIARKRAEINDLEASATFSMAMQEAEIIREGWQRSKALGELAIALAQADYTDKANEAFRKAKVTAKEVMDFWLHPNGQIRDSRQAQVYRCLSEALAKAGKFTEALNILSSPEAIQVYNLLELDPFLGALLNLITIVENNQPKCSFRVLTETIRIAGWVRSDWNNIYELISKSENM